MAWLPQTYGDVRGSLSSGELLEEIASSSGPSYAKCPVTGEAVPFFDLIDVRAIDHLLPINVRFVSSMGWRPWVDRKIEVDGAPLTRRRWAELLGAPAEHIDTIVDGMPPALDAVKLARWEVAKIYRDTQIDAGVDTPKGRVDSDAASRLNISGASIGAMLAIQASAPFSIPWTMQDNSVETHDAEETLALGTAVLDHVSACHAAAQAIRAAIEAASDAEAVEAVDISEGYP